MKNITLNISLENNELFEKEVIEAYRAEAKRVVRKAFDETIRSEIERIAKNILDNELTKPQWGYTGGSIYQKIKEEVLTVSKNIDSKQIQEIVNAVLAHKALRKDEEALRHIAIDEIEKLRDDLIRSIRQIMSNQIFKVNEE